MKTKLVAITATGLLLAVTMVSAAEFQFAGEDKNNGNINIAENETHKNLYAAGGNVSVNGNTLGDLFAAGGMVTLNGVVEKDLNVAGGNLNINSTVGDDARIGGGNVSINGPVTGDLLVGGGNVTISQKAVVGGDLILGSGNAALNSEVKGSAKLAGGQITINSKISGNVDVQSEELVFGPNSEVLGKITYTGPKPAVVSESAKVGSIQYTEIDGRGSARHAARGLLGIATLFKLISLFITGFIILWLFPKKVKAVVTHSHDHTLRSFGVGLLTLVATPIIALVLCITVIGLYLGIALFLTYLITLVFTGVLVLFYVGNLLFRWFKKSNMDAKMDLVLGTIVVLVVSFIPIIGWLLCAIAYLITLGSLVTHFRSEHLN